MLYKRKQRDGKTIDSLSLSSVTATSFPNRDRILNNHHHHHPSTTATMALLRASAVLLALASSVTSIPTFAGLWSSYSTGGSHSIRAPYDDSSIVESLSGPPRGWLQDDTKLVDKDAARIKLRVHLVNQDMDKFQELAMNIATPGHGMYGQHMSQKMIDGIIAPKDESGEMVMEWLADKGLGSYATYSNRGDSVIVEASVAQVEKLLDAEYSAFCEQAS